MFEKIVVFICVAGLVTAVPKPQGTVDDAVDICSLPPVRPSPIACSGFFKKWTFSATSGTCQEFIYGGCGGTENLFGSEADCLARCGKKVVTQQQLVADDKAQQDPCLLPKAPGNCRAHVPSFYFNAESASCESFVYTGCKGNDNRFATQDACADKCKAHLAKSGADDAAQVLSLGADRDTAAAPAAQSSDPCLLPKAAGDCRAHVPSFYFNSAAGNCESFVYTGCKGNDNRFPNQDACLDMCKAHLAKSGADGDAQQQTPVVQVAVKNEVTGEGLTRQERCSLPPIKTEGDISCLAFIPSWTFNATSQACERYVYGGCGKTANLYSNEQDCKAACVDPETRTINNVRQETCLLPVERGSCFAFKPRFAFIREKNRCEYFTYGGCQGNANNFKSADECYSTCGGDLPSQLPACEQVTCPASNQRLIDRGCRPEYKGLACCPTSFTCPEETNTAETGVCWYRGVSYNIGDKIDQISEDNACQSGCTCVASNKHNGGATIKCSTLYCDEPFLPPGKTNCSLVTPPGACCSTYQCLEDVQENATCSFNGKVYLPDQGIPTGNPCRRCKCTEGFDGLDGPGCTDVHCLVENRIGCVPVYNPYSCCPTSYKCLIDSEMSKDKTKIIRVNPKPGFQGVTTLPMLLNPEGRSLESSSPSIPERCQLPKAIGPCKMSRPSFYYDTAKGECTLFYFGGCRGNDNRFDSEEECRNVCQSENNKEESRIIRIESFRKVNESCLLPKVTGPCRMSLPSFYYDSDTRKCLPFYYGGCRGNANRYESIEECQQACEAPGAPSARSSEPTATEVSSQIVEQQVVPSLPARCLLPKQSGPCKMALESYYYDAQRKDCFPFYYGGCRGNENRFESIDECRSSCKLEKNQTRPDVCGLEANPGPCKGHVLAYYFNSRTESCETFWYGGCHGNKNRFETEAACQTKCGIEVTAQLADDNKETINRRVSKCELPADIGPCRGHKERFFYDKTEKKCKLFGYGGCLGNANNFATESDCLKACASDEQTEAVSAFPAGRARARGMGARARVFSNEIQPVEKSLCRLGNVTFELGDRLMEAWDPCEECVCTTPPELTCTRTECPPFPNVPDAVCTMREVPGQCCPVYECVSANPPSIDVCEGVECAADERCQVQEQESPDGSWKPPVGVCVKQDGDNSDSSQF